MQLQVTDSRQEQIHRKTSQIHVLGHPQRDAWHGCIEQRTSLRMSPERAFFSKICLTFFTIFAQFSDDVYKAIGFPHSIAQQQIRHQRARDCRA